MAKLGGRRGNALRTPLIHSADAVRGFFARSDALDYLCLRPLDHIASSWEVVWDRDGLRCVSEEDSFAADLNLFIDEIAGAVRPTRYHEDEDALIEAYLGATKWPQQKKGNRWIVADYASLLEQAASADLHEARLVSAATGRVHAALDFGQMHFDNMEEGHRRILAQVVTIILYQRYCVGTSLFNDREQSEAL